MTGTSLYRLGGISLHQADALQEIGITSIDDLNDAEYRDLHDILEWMQYVQLKQKAQNHVHSEKADQSTESQLAELKRRREYFESRGWDSALDRVEAEIEELEKHREFTEEEQAETEALHEKADWLDDRGFESLAEQTRSKAKEIKND